MWWLVGSFILGAIAGGIGAYIAFLLLILRRYYGWR